MKTKICKICNHPKKITEFRLSKKKIRGNICRECRNNQRRLRYHNHEKHDKEVIQKNRNRIKEWRDNNKIRDKKSKKEWRDNTERGYWSKKMSSIKANCRTNGRDCTISVNDLIELYKKQNGLCAISGRRMSICNNKDLNSLSVDRLNSHKGYTKNNIRLVCWQVNTAKMFGSDEQLFALCEDILNHNN